MLTLACWGSGSPEEAKLLCWSCELLFAVFECPGGCKDARADAGVPGYMQMPRRMQGCSGKPVPVEELRLFPSKQTLRGVSISNTRCGGRAGSQERLPGASSLCLVHVAMAGWCGQQLLEIDRILKTLTRESSPTAVPCQIACYPEA